MIFLSSCIEPVAVFLNAVQKEAIKTECIIIPVSYRRIATKTILRSICGKQSESGSIIINLTLVFKLFLIHTPMVAKMIIQGTDLDLDLRKKQDPNKKTNVFAI